MRGASLALAALLAAAAARLSAEEALTVQVVALPGPPQRLEMQDGRVGLRRLRVRLADGAWARLGDCVEGLCAEPLDRARSEARLPQDALPGSKVARGKKGVRLAWLAEPALRLGDDEPVAARIVAVDHLNGRHELAMPLDAGLVGPDIEIVDADGDGADEIVAVVGEEGQGRSLAVIELREDGLTIAARSRDTAEGHESLRLGPAADLDGDGVPELSLLTEEGALEIWRYAEGQLARVAAAAGFAGDAAGLAATDLDADGHADLIVPVAGRQSLAALSLDEEQVVEKARVSLSAEAVTNILAIPMPGKPRPAIAVGLADGTLAIVR